MIDLVKLLVEIEKEAARERGVFSLFGVFLREDAEDKWDVVISAPWIKDNKRKFLEYIIKKLQGKLDREDLLRFSKVIVLDPPDPFVSVVNKIISTEHTSAEFTNCYFDNISIKHAFIITSKKRRNN